MLSPKMATEQEKYRRIYTFLAHHCYLLGFGKEEEEPEKSMLGALLLEKWPSNIFKADYK